jgi:hypothetical protein
MKTAFIFGGALTAAQAQAIREAKGSLVLASDDLSEFKTVVIGHGVKAPTGDFEVIDLGDFSAAKEKKLITPKAAVSSTSD